MVVKICHRKSAVEKTNTRICQWIPGADELAQWGVTKDTAWNTRKKPDDLPEYIGTNIQQKPRGCYPISKVKIDMKAIADIKKQKEGMAFGLKFPPKDDLTEAELAEAQIKQKPLTPKQIEKKKEIKKKNEELLAKLRARGATYETKGQGGGKRRKTRKRRKKRRKTRRKRRRKTRRKRKSRKRN